MAKSRRKLSAAQIRAGFGGKRRQTAQKHRHGAPKRKAKKRNAAPRAHSSSHRPRTKPKKRAVARKRNLGELYLLTAGNPASRKGKKSMAHKAKKRATARHHAGSPRRKAKHVTHRRRRSSNPGVIGSPKAWLMNGAAVLGGVIVTRAVPQAILGDKNSGGMGYFANAVTAVGGGWLLHMFLKSPAVTAFFIAGGFASIISRVMSDQTPFGKSLALSGGPRGIGWGDYQFSNIVGTVPQRVISQNSAVVENALAMTGRPAYSHVSSGDDARRWGGGGGCY